MTREEFLAAEEDGCKKLFEGLGEGPWDVDKHIHRKEYEIHGYPALVRRNPTLGMWCGYIGVPEGHPWFGISWEELSVNCHWGASFAQKDDGFLFHEKDPERKLWWVGFDCGHAFDLVPGLAIFKSYQMAITLPDGMDMDSYRNFMFACEQIKQMADQAVEVMNEISDKKEA